MDITIFAIGKNDEILIRSWLDHLAEIPQIKNLHFTDTGSTDNTVEIIKEYKRKTENLNICLKQKEFTNFEELRNFSLNDCKKEFESEWMMFLDTDEFFNCNAVEGFQKLEEKEQKSWLDDFNQVQFYHVKFFDFDTIYFRKHPAKTSKVGGKIFYSHDKATMKLCRPESIGPFKNTLHELPTFEGNEIEFSLLGKRMVKETELEKDFFCIHYDLAKLQQQARVNKTSVQYEIGKKRLVYRKLKAAEVNGKMYSPEWAKTADKDDIIQLGVDHFIECLSQHTFIETDKLTFIPAKLHCQAIKDQFFSKIKA